MMPCMDSKTVKPSATLSTFISKEPSICESLARPILPHTGQRRPSTRSSRDAIPQICNLRLLRSMSYLAATIKFGKREFPSLLRNLGNEKIRPELLRARYLHGARGCIRPCRQPQVYFTSKGTRSRCRSRRGARPPGTPAPSSIRSNAVAL